MEEELWFRQHPLVLPEGRNKLLLLSCCAPCCGAMMEALAASGIDFTVFFHNPNIHPREEYEKRKKENIRYAEKLGIPFVEADYNRDNWFQRVKGLENEPERGARCTECFSLRLERTALYAHEYGFPLFTSSLGVSRWKNLEQVNECGHRAAARYADLRYWDYNWRKSGASDRRNEIIKSEGFYEQEYCGCVFSHRAANERRAAAGRPKLETTPDMPQATNHPAYTVSQKSAE